jgi:pimeloyl-ACP methyl ester carboxylesterase
MKHITSKDGTAIACWYGGQGQPLLLVHGTAGDSLSWKPLLNLLQSQFEVWIMDRRGRGQSGDNTRYSLQSEAQDIAAVIATLDQKVHVFGHSFGGLCTLEAALLSDNLASLMLYEPPLSLAGSGWSAELDQQMQTLLNAGEKEQVVLLFFRDVLRMAETELFALQMGANWSARIAEAHTVHRELQAIDHYLFESQKFTHLSIPTLLLLGSDSPPRRYAIADSLKNCLCNSQLMYLDGQQHSAIRTAPALLASKMLAFLKPDLC